jgi:hypothetical protein
MMCHGYRNQSTYFRPEISLGNLSVYKGVNVNFIVFEFPLRSYCIQMIGDNNCARL